MTLDPLSATQVHKLFDVHSGDFVNVDVIAPGIDHAVTARRFGEIQVWNLESGRLESSISVGLEITAMAASPFARLVVVGTDTGHLFYLDVTKASRPRIVERVHQHNGPVKQIKCVTSFSWNCVSAT